MANHKFVLKHLWTDNGLVCANVDEVGLIVICPENVFFNGNTDSLRKYWIDAPNGIRYRKITTTKSCYLPYPPSIYKTNLESQPHLHSCVHESFKKFCSILKIQYDYVIPRQEFDLSGNLTFDCTGDGHFKKFEYDSNGRCIYDEITWQPKRIGGTPEVFWIKYEYDSYGIVINETNSHGEWKKSIRNDDGSYSVLNDDGIESTYIYNTSGNVISIKSSDGTWSKYEYDSNGNETVYENSHGFWFIADYDSNNNIVNMDYQKTVINF